MYLSIREPWSMRRRRSWNAGPQLTDNQGLEGARRLRVPDNSVSINPLPYRAGDMQLSGFVARDDRQAGVRPGIVVVHDAWGMGENVKMRARTLAELGFIALAADLDGEGHAPRLLDDARAKVEYFKSNFDALRERIIAGLDALASHSPADPPRIRPFA